MKQVYRKVYKEYLNGTMIYVDYGQVQYKDIKERDKLYQSLDWTLDFNEFRDTVKLKGCKSREFEVVTRLGKDILKHCDWDFSHKYKKKDFKEYYSETYIEYCDYYTIKQLRDSLPAEQYIDWCKDHGIKIDSAGLKL